MRSWLRHSNNSGLRASHLPPVEAEDRPATRDTWTRVERYAPVHTTAEPHLIDRTREIIGRSHDRDQRLADDVLTVGTRRSHVHGEAKLLAARRRRARRALHSLPRPSPAFVFRRWEGECERFTSKVDVPAAPALARARALVAPHLADGARSVSGRLRGRAGGRAGAIGTHRRRSHVDNFVTEALTRRVTAGDAHVEDLDAP